MFGLSIFEILVIGVLFLIFVKPEEMPATIRKIAFFLGKARRAMNDARELIDEIKYMEPSTKNDKEPSLADKIAAATPDNTPEDSPASQTSSDAESTVDTNDEWVRPTPRDQQGSAGAGEESTPDK